MLPKICKLSQSLPEALGWMTYYFDMTGLGNQDVLRLQISMSNAISMKILNGMDDFGNDELGAFHVQFSAMYSLEQRVELAPLGQVGNEINVVLVHEPFS